MKRNSLKIRRSPTPLDVAGELDSLRYHAARFFCGGGNTTATALATTADA